MATSGFWGEDTKCIYWNNTAEFMKMDAKLQRMGKHCLLQNEPREAFSFAVPNFYDTVDAQ